MHINSQTKIAPEDRCSRCNFFIRGVGGGYIFIFTLFEPSFTMAISPRCKLVEIEA